MLFALIAFAATASAFEASVCGNNTLPLTPGKKNVLLIGDSISMSPPYTPGGYGAALAALLTAKGVAVQHAGGAFSGGQCGDTRLGLICTNLTNPDGYLSFEGKFDLVHANWGLHDLANYSAALPRLPLPQYSANLQEIYRRIATKTSAFMWTSTTPAPNVTTSFGRTYTLVEEYNKAALVALQAVVPGKLLVNDLWSAMVKYCGDHYTSCSLQLPANVHLTKDGIAFTAAAAAADILAALGM